MAERVGEVKRSVRRHRDVPRIVELGEAANATVDAVADVAVAGQGRDDAVRPDGAKAVVVIIGKQDAAIRGDGETVRVVELRHGRGRAVAGEAGGAGAGQGVDDAVEPDAADLVVEGIDDVDGS